ncbi:hypothetical protein MLD38_020749 [Melastoma candidum]|uniref:Uncharacterized protein n=1 Tax=Melastoma candidum TaxID=119954 RepID=A0ACB9QDF6_9MYRT|nr:hypothetical protein MLD38_020749 [Melastoma candidum]
MNELKPYSSLPFPDDVVDVVCVIPQLRCWSELPSPAKISTFPSGALSRLQCSHGEVWLGVALYPLRRGYCLLEDAIHQ